MWDSLLYWNFKIKPKEKTCLRTFSIWWKEWVAEEFSNYEEQVEQIIFIIGYSGFSCEKIKLANEYPKSIICKMSHESQSEGVRSPEGANFVSRTSSRINLYLKITRNGIFSGKMTQCILKARASTPKVYSGVEIGVGNKERALFPSIEFPADGSRIAGRGLGKTGYFSNASTFHCVLFSKCIPVFGLNVKTSNRELN